MTKEKWFHPKRHTGWEKDLSQKTRRNIVYRNTKNEAEGKNGRLLLAERQMNALANVTTDAETKNKALSECPIFQAETRETDAKRHKKIH